MSLCLSVHAHTHVYVCSVRVCVLLLGDLMASATWLANPVFLLSFSRWYQGILGSYLQKDGRHHVDLPFAGIVVYKFLVVIIVCVCGGMCVV